MRIAIAKVIPPLFQNAHLRHLFSKLRSKMLNLPDGCGLLLYGPPGVGKSHAICALMRHYILRWHKLRRITWEELCLAVRDTYSAKSSENDVIETYQIVDKLCLEDVDTTVGVGSQESDFSLPTLLLILDYRLDQRKPMFITTNKNLQELSRSFNARIASRIAAMCEVVPAYGKDKPTQTRHRKVQNMKAHKIFDRKKIRQRIGRNSA